MRRRRQVHQMQFGAEIETVSGARQVIVHHNRLIDIER